MTARMLERASAAPLMSTKLVIPRRRKDILRRPRLVDFIHEMIDRELFLVVAPAGYGKTTLLVDFASDSDIPVCWYSLGPTDAEPAVFLDYLVASIQSHFPRFGAETRRVMAQTTNFSSDLFAIVAALVNDIQDHIPDYFVVVLDDYHEVNDSRISEILDALLKHAPDNLKLVISSRTIPRIRLSRLAATRQATGVGSNDLRFTTDEVRQLMRETQQLALSDRAVEELTASSEGWITGIILTTHTMWQGLFESMIQSAGQEQLYQYLANEVFERQPAQLQEFLLATCVLDDMDPAVAGQVSGVPNPQQLFKQLEDNNLFVTRIGGRNSAFRYHHLFRDFLRSRLDDGRPGHRSELDRRAGQAYAQRGEHELAIRHFLAARGFEEAAASIAAIAQEAFDRGRLDTLAGWIDALPEEFRLEQPRIGLLRAQVAIQKGDLEPAISLCERLEARGGELGQTDLVAEVKVNRAAALRLLGHNEPAIALCEQALEVFGEEISRRRALALRTIGSAYWRLGQLELARDQCELSYQLFEQIGDESSLAYVRNDLGAIAVWLGQLEEGREHFQRSAQCWEKSNNLGRYGLALSNLGVVSYLEEDYDQAIQLLQAALKRGEEGLLPFTQVVAGCSLGDVYRDIGEHGLAEQSYLQALEVVLNGTDRAELTNVYTAMANSYRLQGLHSRADATLRRAEAAGGGLSSNYPLAQCKLAAGICSAEQGRYKRASRLLREAMSLFLAGGARYPTARAMFHLAIVEFQKHNRVASDEMLTQCLDLLEDLGYHQFLTVEGPRNWSFLEQAASRAVGEGFLANLLTKLRRPHASVSAKSRLSLAPANVAVQVRAKAFGRPEVRVQGRSVALREWGTHASRELFFYLLLHPEGARKDELMEILAPNSPPARANSQFHVAAYRLRRALYKGCLRFEDDYYQLDPAMQCDFDVRDFQQAVEEGDRAKHCSDQTLKCFDRALTLYHGRFLEGSYSEWATAEQARFERQFLHAVNGAARGYLARGEFSRGLEIAERGLSVDNGIEELHEIVIEAYLALGDAAAANRHYGAYTAYARDELGISPAPRLKQLIARAEKRATHPASLVAS